LGKNNYIASELVSYAMLRMTHPSRNFFVLSLFCVQCMFVWLRVQGFESSVNKVFQKEKLVNSKTIRFTVLYKGVSSAGANLVQNFFMEPLTIITFSQLLFESSTFSIFIVKFVNFILNLFL
jgi:hypothetical protein